MNRWGKGREGERRAAHYLSENGYRVLERNFRSRRGEIDLIAEKGDRIAFVEVKHWAYLDRGELEYAIDRRKQRRIVATSRQFLFDHPELQNKHCGFDVILVSSNTPEVLHYEDAFWLG
jgi:putative endonuclease